VVLTAVALLAGVAAAGAGAQPGGVSCNAPPVPPPLGPPELAFLQALNDYRQGMGRPPLVPSPLLQRAAMHQAAYGEVRNATFDGDEDHFDDGRWFDLRTIDCGYDFIASRSENLSSFEVTDPSRPGDEIVVDPADEARALLDAFRSSPRHEGIQTNPRYRAVGLGRVRRPGTFKVWWVVLFGSVTDETGVRPQALRDVQLPSLDEDPCLPTDGAAACDDERLGLWSGDAATWAPRLVADEQPVTPEALLLYTLSFRADAGSEPSRAILGTLQAGQALD